MLAPSQNEIDALSRVVDELNIPSDAVLPDTQHEDVISDFTSSLPTVVKTVVLEDEVDILNELENSRAAGGSTPALEAEIYEVKKRIDYSPCFEPAKTMLKTARLVHHVKSLDIEAQGGRRDDDLDRKLVVLACTMDVHASVYAESHMNSTGYKTNEEEVQRLKNDILEDTDAFFKEKLSFDLFPKSDLTPTVFVTRGAETGAGFGKRPPRGAYRGVFPKLLETVFDLGSFPETGGYDNTRMHKIVTKPIHKRSREVVEAMARALREAPDRIVAMILCGGVMVGGLPSVLLTLQKVHAQEMSKSASIDATSFYSGPTDTVQEAKLASNIVHARALLDKHLPCLASLCSSPGSAGAGMVFSSTAGKTIAIAAAVMLMGAHDYKMAAQFSYAFESGGLSSAMSTWKPSDSTLRRLYDVVMDGGLASEDSVIHEIASYASLAPPSSVVTNTDSAPPDSASWEKENGVNMAWSAIAGDRIRSLAALKTKGGDFWSESLLLVKQMALFGDIGFPNSVFKPSDLLEGRIVRSSVVYHPSMPCTLNTVLLWGIKTVSSATTDATYMDAPLESARVDPPKRRRTMNAPVVDEVIAAFELRKLAM